MLVTSLGDIIVAIDGKNMDVTWRQTRNCVLISPAGIV